METWRLLDLSVHGAEENMALDRAIQLARSRGAVPPTLRLYRWEKPTATIGRFQDAADVDTAACLRHGVDVARRFTGGRGVLHDDEVTYAVVAGEADGIPRGVAASYRYLSNALAEVYRELGVAAQITQRETGIKGSAACYLHATQADLSVGAAKLSGSAQVWYEQTCLQHGSFVISRDVAREAEVFGLDGAAADQLRASTVTLADLGGGRELGRDTLRDAIVAAFERELDITLEPGELSSEETEMARELLEEVHIDL